MAWVLTPYLLASTKTQRHSWHVNQWNLRRKPVNLTVPMSAIDHYQTKAYALA